MINLPIQRSFTDDFGVEIVFYEWPVANPKAVIQIAHGLGEHARRYDDMAATLNRAGFGVYADDHRGHGRTGVGQVAKNQTKKLGNLGPRIHRNRRLQQGLEETSRINRLRMAI